MCTDYRRTRTYADYETAFSETRVPLVWPERHAAPNLEPQCEVRPTNRAVVFRRHGEGVELVKMRWGLIPWFHRGAVKEWKAATFNARSETIDVARSYRDAFRRRRVLIAADGWVEWKGEGKPKPKFYIEPRGGEPICLAGIWDRCETTDAGLIESFSMVTQPPGELSDVHDRAPVVLRQPEWSRWLDLEADVSDLLTAEPQALYSVRSWSPLALI